MGGVGLCNKYFNYIFSILIKFEKLISFLVGEANLVDNLLNQFFFSVSIYLRKYKSF